MDNQHKLIKGYRDLDAREIAMMNTIKADGEVLKDLIENLRKVKGVDQRWVDIAETHLQQGIMAAVRAVVKPDGF